jgi:hypothetical protein
MIVRFNYAALRETRWHELVIRFVLGGAMTVVTGWIASRFGSIVGGLFLAFPAIFPASVTLIEKHALERKEKKGLPGAQRGRNAAALDARGAVLGSFGLFAFAFIAWMALAPAPFAAFILAPLGWLGVAGAGWLVRRKL